MSGKRIFKALLWRARTFAARFLSGRRTIPSGPIKRAVAGQVMSHGSEAGFVSCQGASEAGVLQGTGEAGMVMY